MAVKWRKEMFWTVLIIGGSPKAVRKSGFSDGKYYYYRESEKTWHAVLPDCGLSIATGETRKECRAAALKAEALLESGLSERQQEWYDQGKRLINEKTVFWI